MSARPDNLFETRTKLPPIPPTVDEVLLVFNLTRARLRGVEPSDLPQGLEPAPPELAGTPQPNVLRLRVTTNGHGPPSIPQSGMRILSEVEPVQLVKVVFQDGDRAEVYADPVDMCPGRSGRFQPVSFAGSTFLDAAAYVAEYERAIAADGALAPYRRYFLELDRASHAKLLDLRIETWGLPEVRQIKVAVDEVMRELRQRILTRKHRHAAGAPAPAALPPIDDIRRGYLGKISAIKLRLLREHLGIQDPARDDLTPAWRAFLGFAGGDLRIRLASHAYTCQPSTGFFFLFGEFALLCCDSGVAPDAWSRLAAPLVAARDIYVDVFAPDTKGPHDFDDFNACNFDRGRRAGWSAAEIDDLRVTYSAMDRAELSQRSCHQVGTHLAGVTG